MSTELFREVMQLPPAERLLLADEIYRSIDLQGAGESIPADLLAELERRDAEYEANPAGACSVEELEKKLFPTK